MGSILLEKTLLYERKKILHRLLQKNGGREGEVQAIAKRRRNPGGQGIKPTTPIFTGSLKKIC